MVLNWGTPKNDGKPLDCGYQNFDTLIMSNVWRQSPDPLDAPLNFSRFPPGQMRHSAVPQRIRSGCVSLTDFKTAVGMQRGSRQHTKTMFCDRKTCQPAKTTFCDGTNVFSTCTKRRFATRIVPSTCKNAFRDRKTCRQHTKTTFGHRKKHVLKMQRRTNQVT